MPSIGDLLLNMMGKPDPRAALMASAMGGAPPAQPGGGDTPAGAGTQPGAPAAPPVPQEAQVYQSPSQLFDLYTQLVERQENSREINRGIGLIGASLAHPENRAGIMAAFNGAGGGTNPGTMINSLIDFQTKSAALSQKAQQRTAVPALAKQYGLDPETALFLFDSGNLDTTIADLAKGKKQVTKDAEGRTRIVDITDGSISEPLDPAKPREIIVQPGPDGSQIAVYKDDLTPVGGREPLVPAEGNTEFEKNFRNAQKERPDLTRERYRKEVSATTQGAGTPDASGKLYPDPPKDMVWKMVDGVVQVDERGAPIAVPIGGTDIDLKNKEAEVKAKEAKAIEDAKGSAKQATADVVTTDIDRVNAIIDAKKDSWVPATGLGAAVAGWAPGTAQYDAEGLITTIKANLGFDKLQAMRAASPTGAALGPVSDFENQLLQSVMGNVDLKQSREQVQYNLNRIKRLYQGVVSGEFVKDGKPDMAAVAKAEQEVIKGVPIEELMKMYPGDE
jgi:hypothetical protein